MAKSPTKSSIAATAKGEIPLVSLKAVSTTNSILIVEDTPYQAKFFRESITPVIAQSRWAVLQDPARSLETARQILTKNESIRMVLIDISLVASGPGEPELNGYAFTGPEVAKAAIEIAARRRTKMGVVGMSDKPSAYEFRHMIEAEVHAFWDKKDLGGLPQLVQHVTSAIDNAIDVSWWCSSTLTPLNHVIRSAPDLTEQDRQLLSMLSKGLGGSKNAAKHYNVNVRQAQNRLKALRDQLGVVDVGQLVKWAVDHGYLPAGSSAI